MDKVSKGQRMLEDSGGKLLPAVERHKIEYNSLTLLNQRDSRCVMNIQTVPNVLKTFM